MTGKHIPLFNSIRHQQLFAQFFRATGTNGVERTHNTPWTCLSLLGICQRFLLLLPFPRLFTHFFLSFSCYFLIGFCCCTRSFVLFWYVVFYIETLLYSLLYYINICMLMFGCVWVQVCCLCLFECVCIYDIEGTPLSLILLCNLFGRVVFVVMAAIELSTNNNDIRWMSFVCVFRLL